MGRNIELFLNPAVEFFGPSIAVFQKKGASRLLTFLLILTCREKGQILIPDL